VIFVKTKPATICGSWNFSEADSPCANHAGTNEPAYLRRKRLHYTTLLTKNKVLVMV